MIVHAVEKHSAPDDHLATSPHCRVVEPASGRVVRAHGRPAVRAWIIPPTGVQIARVAESAPDGHFAAGPYGGLTNSANGRVNSAYCRPTILARIVPSSSI